MNTMVNIILSAVPALIIAGVIYLLIKRSSKDGTSLSKGIAIAVASFVVFFVPMYLVIANNR